VTTLADNNIQAVKPGATDVVTVAGSSDTTAAVGGRTNLIRLISSTACFITIGATPVATSSDMYLPADMAEYFRVEPGVDKVAVIQQTAGGFLYMTEMN
jgi:hypothetical protein